MLSAEIDNYAALREENGQEYADRIICRVAEVLCGSFRSMDHIFRLDEDKFVIIMSRLGSTGRDLIPSKIDRINCELQERSEGFAPISLSVGVAFSDGEKSGGSVFQDANTALENMKEIRKSGDVMD